MKFIIMKFIIVLSLLIFVCDCQNNNGKINFELEDVYTEVGQNAVVPCKYTTELEGKPKIKWFRLENGEQVRLFEVNLETENVIRDSGLVRNISINSEDATLTFTSVTLEDNQRFSTLVCEVDFGAPADESKSLKFSVVVLPVQDPTTMLFQDNGIYIPRGDKQIVGTCTSGKGFPAPRIEFYKKSSLGDGESASQGVSDELQTDNIEDQNTDGTFSTTQTLYYNITDEDDKALFSCKVSGGAGDKTSEQMADFPVIRVNHPTKKVEIHQDPAIAYVGEEVRYTCTADGYPDAEISLDGTSSDDIIIIPSMDNLEKTVSCSAGNELNTELVTTTINIKPLYSIDPSITGDNTVPEGGSFTLSCNSGGNPEPNYKWLKNSQELEETMRELQVDRATFEDSGEYKCQINFDDHPALNKISPLFQVSVEGLVFDTKSVDVLNARHDVANLVCEAQSYPTPTFKWTRNGEDVSVEPNLTKIGYTYKSTLQVGPLDHTLSKAAYNCTVSNSVFESMTKTFFLPELLEQASSSAVTIIIVVIILILVALVVLAVLYNKGYIGKKKPKEEAKDGSDENNEEATTSPDDDVEAAKTQEEPKETEKLVPGNGEQQQN